jgi:hypothetical protein
LDHWNTGWLGRVRLRHRACCEPTAGGEVTRLSTQRASAPAYALVGRRKNGRNGQRWPHLDHQREVQGSTLNAKTTSSSSVPRCRLGLLGRRHATAVRTASRTARLEVCAKGLVGVAGSWIGRHHRVPRVLPRVSERVNHHRGRGDAAGCDGTYLVRRGHCRIYGAARHPTGPCTRVCVTRAAARAGREGGRPCGRRQPAARSSGTRRRLPLGCIASLPAGVRCGRSTAMGSRSGRSVTTRRARWPPTCATHYAASHRHTYQ